MKPRIVVKYARLSTFRSNIWIASFPTEQINRVRSTFVGNVNPAPFFAIFWPFFVPSREGPLSAGYFVRPTVFAEVRNEWRIAREEIFGPVLVAIPWTEESEAIRMANDSHYGLAAYVWTHDIGKALRAAHAIESGWVQVNQGLGQSLGHSYGGFKQSGIGREFSLEGMLDSFTQRKSVTVNLQF